MDAIEKVVIPPEQEGEIRRDAKLKERRRLVGMRANVAEGKPEPEQWEYISLRVSGLSSLAAVIKIAQDGGEELERKDAENRAMLWERKFKGQIDSHLRDRYMSDADFEAWARLKVEQIASNPAAHSQSALRAIMVLKKMREEQRARNPEALKRQLLESAKGLERLDAVEAEAVRRGIARGEG